MPDKVELHGPIPIVYSIEDDRIFAGQPGERHADIKDAKFNPNGILEGVYDPKGNLQIRTDTDLPWTVYHLTRLWYSLFPELPIKGVYRLVGEDRFRLASSQNIAAQCINTFPCDPLWRPAHELLQYGNVYIAGETVKAIVGRETMGPGDYRIAVEGVDPDVVREVVAQHAGAGALVRVAMIGFETPERHLASLDRDRAMVSLATGELLDPYREVENWVSGLRQPNSAARMLIDGNEPTSPPNRVEARSDASASEAVRLLGARDAALGAPLPDVSGHPAPLGWQDSAVPEVRGDRRLAASGWSLDDAQGGGDQPSPLDVALAEAARLDSLDWTQAPLLDGHVALMRWAGWKLEPTARGSSHMWFQWTDPMGNVHRTRTASDEHKGWKRDRAVDNARQYIVTCMSREQPCKCGHNWRRQLRQAIDVEASRPLDLAPHSAVNIDGRSYTVLDADPDLGVVELLDHQSGEYRYYNPTTRVFEAGRVHALTPQMGFQPQAPRTVYRGLMIGAMEQPEDAAGEARYLASLTPEQIRDEVVRTLQTDIHGAPRAGVHWSSDPGVAMNFATDRDTSGYRFTYDDDTIVLGLLLKAEIDPGYTIGDEDSDEWESAVLDRQAFGESGFEAEVMPRDNAPIMVTEAEFLLDGGEYDMTTVAHARFDQPQQVVANILDPIRPTLSTYIYDDPTAAEPDVKQDVIDFARNTIESAMREAGWPDPDDYLTLAVTGSLTTFQYDDEGGSDFDVSLFIDARRMPEWVRADLVKVMVEKVDGTLLPGTKIPLQAYVVPADIRREDLYVKGRRSGYDLDKREWIVPPDKGLAREVSPSLKAYGQMVVDKMRLLLMYSPEAAKQFWKQLKKSRQESMRSGGDDFSDQNVAYKSIANAGLHPAIERLTGEKIAKVAMADRTGDPEIDALIEEFLRTPMGDWTTSTEFNEALRNPAEAAGMCDAVSEDFAAFAKQRGWDVAVTMTDLDEMGYRPTGEPAGEIMNEAGEIVPGFYFDHTINEIYHKPDGTKFNFPVAIDWTASQYGYTDHPKVSSFKTAAAPEGMEITRDDWDFGGPIIEYDAHISGTNIGKLKLEGDDGVFTIVDVQVAPEYRRMGVATELYRRAQQELGAANVRHHPSKSDSGQPWAEHVGSGLGEDANGIKDWRHKEWGGTGQYDQMPNGWEGHPDESSMTGPYECDECGQHFDDYGQWRSHVVDEHTSTNRAPRAHEPYVDGDATFPPHFMEWQRVNDIDGVVASLVDFSVPRGTMLSGGPDDQARQDSERCAGVAGANASSERGGVEPVSSRGRDAAVSGSGGMGRGSRSVAPALLPDGWLSAHRDLSARRARSSAAFDLDRAIAEDARLDDINWRTLRQDSGPQVMRDLGWGLVRNTAKGELMWQWIDPMGNVHTHGTNDERHSKQKQRKDAERTFLTARQCMRGQCRFHGFDWKTQLQSAIDASMSEFADEQAIYPGAQIMIEGRQWYVTEVHDGLAVVMDPSDPNQQTNGKLWDIREQKFASRRTVVGSDIDARRPLTIGSLEEWHDA